MSTTRQFQRPILDNPATATLKNALAELQCVNRFRIEALAVVLYRELLHINRDAQKRSSRVTVYGSFDHSCTNLTEPFIPSPAPGVPPSCCRYRYGPRAGQKAQRIFRRLLPESLTRSSNTTPHSRL
jgi:hypothetical protein